MINEKRELILRQALQSLLIIQQTCQKLPLNVRQVHALHTVEQAILLFFQIKNQKFQIQCKSEQIQTQIQEQLITTFVGFRAELGGCFIIDPSIIKPKPILYSNQTQTQQPQKPQFTNSIKQFKLMLQSDKIKVSQTQASVCRTILSDLKSQYVQTVNKSIQIQTLSQQIQRVFMKIINKQCDVLKNAQKISQDSFQFVSQKVQYLKQKIRQAWFKDKSVLLEHVSVYSENVKPYVVQSQHSVLQTMNKKMSSRLSQMHQISKKLKQRIKFLQSEWMVERLQKLQSQNNMLTQIMGIDVSNLIKNVLVDSDKMTSNQLSCINNVGNSLLQKIVSIIDKNGKDSDRLVDATFLDEHKKQQNKQIKFSELGSTKMHIKFYHEKQQKLSKQKMQKFQTRFKNSLNKYLQSKTQAVQFIQDQSDFNRNDQFFIPENNMVNVSTQTSPHYHSYKQEIKYITKQISIPYSKERAKLNQQMQFSHSISSKKIQAALQSYKTLSLQDQYILKIASKKTIQSQRKENKKFSNCSEKVVKQEKMLSFDYIPNISQSQASKKQQIQKMPKIQNRRDRQIKSLSRQRPKLQPIMVNRFQNQNKIITSEPQSHVKQSQHFHKDIVQHLNNVYKQINQYLDHHKIDQIEQLVPQSSDNSFQISKAFFKKVQIQTQHLFTDRFKFSLLRCLQFSLIQEQNPTYASPFKVAKKIKLKSPNAFDQNQIKQLWIKFHCQFKHLIKQFKNFTRQGNQDLFFIHKLFNQQHQKMKLKTEDKQTHNESAVLQEDLDFRSLVNRMRQIEQLKEKKASKVQQFPDKTNNNLIIKKMQIPIFFKSKDKKKHERIKKKSISAFQIKMPKIKALKKQIDPWEDRNLLDINHVDLNSVL